MQGEVDSFNNTVGLRVPSGCRFRFDTIALEELLELVASEFAALVIRNDSRSGVSAKPLSVQCQCHCLTALVRNFADFEPRCGRVDHGECPELDRRVLLRVFVGLTERVGSDKVNAQGVPGNAFDVLFGGSFPKFFGFFLSSAQIAQLLQTLVTMGLSPAQL